MSTLYSASKALNAESFSRSNYVDGSNQLPFDQNNDLSISEIKRLFFMWFNSISNDGKSLNISQFSTIINRIFSSSSSSLTETEISQIFNQLLSNNDNSGSIYYSKFLSQCDHVFANIMSELLQNDPTAVSTLQSVPNSSTNNPANNTLQQILHDQVSDLYIF